MFCPFSIKKLKNLIAGMYVEIFWRSNTLLNLMDQIEESLIYDLFFFLGSETIMFI